VVKSPSIVMADEGGAMAAVSQPLDQAAVDAYAAPAVPMADHYPHATNRRLLAVRSAADDPQLLRLHWDDGRQQAVHALVLRESCACVHCRHGVSLERTLDQAGYPLDLRPVDWRITAAGELEIRWSPDGHVSRYAAGWLRHAGRVPQAASAPAPWGAEMAGRLRRFAFGEVMRRDGVLLDWLQALRDHGLAYLEAAPQEPGTLRSLLNRVAYVRETNFGVLFDVAARIDANSNAYTSIALEPHVDLPTREYQPGFQFLHCLVNRAAGGASLYCDGFRLAAGLADEDPAAFAMLTRVPVHFRFQDEAADYEAVAPIIGLAADGRVDEIRFNPALMTWPDCPPAEVPEFYRAYRALLAQSRRADNLVEVTMAAGQIAGFDNRRVLHGRRAFDPGCGHRHLQGAYLEREDLLSRIRVLRRMAPEPAEMEI